MSNDMYLDDRMWDGSHDAVPIRNGFGEGLKLAGEADGRVVALCSDLTGSTKMNLFRDAFPERFFETGIAEQSMASVASGLAAMGKTPFISSYAMFSPGRNWEQIRTTICYNNVPVIIAGSHAGVSVGPDGGTHQAIEDIAITRVIPRMTVVAPCDSIDARKATLALAEYRRPAYLRLAREATPVVTTEDTPFEIGKARTFFRPDGEADVGIIVAGTLTYNAIKAAHELESENIRARVVNLATIKPIDREAVIELARATGRIVTVEEHQVAGGLGSAVSEVLAETNPVPMRFIGVRDAFGQSGEPDELVSHYGMDIKAIKHAVRDILGRVS